MSLHTTASQTVGPFFRIGLEPLYVPSVVGSDVPGERVTIRGRVVDGDGNPVLDAVLETWQADAHGKYAHPEDTRPRPATPGFTGFGRVPTDDQGQFTLTTIKPGRVAGPGAFVQAPHLVVLLFMRGLLRHLVTRMYFPDEPGNDADPILRLVPPVRRGTLIAQRSPQDAAVLVWNVSLQGADETVFFDA
jgi:protocatechuate 3,4-dioxygenase, alpha subunit